MRSPTGIGQFLREVGSDWIAAFGGVPSILLSVAAFYVSNHALRILFVVAAFVGVLWAAYSIWFRKACELEEERAKHKQPVLKGELTELFLAAYTPADLQGTSRCGMAALLRVVLHNESDCSTTIRSYGLTVEDRDGVHSSEYLGDTDQCVIERGHPYQDTFGGTIASKPERPTDLAKDTATNPLVRGVHREGCLRFNVLEINPRSAETARYCLTAIDSFGGKHDICRGNPPYRTERVANLNSRQILGSEAADAARDSRTSQLRIKPDAGSRYVMAPAEKPRPGHFKGAFLEFRLMVENTGSRKSSIDGYEIEIVEFQQVIQNLKSIEGETWITGRHGSHGLEPKSILSDGGIIRVDEENTTKHGVLLFFIPDVILRQFLNAGLIIEGQARFGALNCRLKLTDTTGSSTTAEFTLRED